MKSPILWIRAAGAAAAALLLGAEPTIAYTFKTLYAFPKPYAGEAPVGALVRKHGVLYGTTIDGGKSNGGTVFSFDQTNGMKILHKFQNLHDGEGPDGLIADRNGNLYGVATLGSVFEVTRSGTLVTLYTFNNPADGADPIGRLLLDKKGNLYGTSSDGGSGCNGNGCGTIYKLTPNDTLAVLHVFSGSDGAQPAGGLVADKLGNLYGVTHEGGTGCEGFGCGTVYKLSPDGQESVLYAFTGGTDGETPVGELVIDATGNLFGVASGGESSCGSHANLYCGIVFKVAPDGTKTIVHTFVGSDGAGPSAGLIGDNSGNLYGTTEAGGSGCGDQGCGTVFMLAPDGTYTLLHAFIGGEDGLGPDGPLAINKRGDLFGTTVQGGTRGCSGYGCGTLFEISP